MDEAFERFRKKARAVAAALKTVERADRALARTPRDPAAVAGAADAAIRALEAAGGVDAVVQEVRQALEAARAEARAALEHERALLAGRVAEGLQAAGIAVEGNLPQLRAGPFTLEFDFGGKARVTIWFGPKKERLAVMPLDADALVRKVVEMHRDLFRGEDDTTAFLADVERAYRVCLARFALADGERVPITALMAEVAFLRQDERFVTDPRREHFRPFGRVEFAAALSRLRTLRVGSRELRLDVATLSQTRKPADHLWVPRGREGVNVATAAFIRVAPEGGPS